MHIARAVFVATGLLAFGTRDAAAQDGRWAPWLGCWEMVRDSVREGAAVRGDDRSPVPAPPPLVARAVPRVCVTVAGADAVKLTTTVEGQATLEETIVANGSQRPIEDGSCRGSQRAEWSKRGTRLYSQATLTCGPELRSVSGLSLIEAGGTWLDIRTIRIGSRETTRVSRYQRAANEPAAARAADPVFTLDDVKEGSAKVSARVVEAAIVETRPAVRLSSRQLIDLSDAHVPENVIDLLVALAYPERFVVERTVRRDAGGFPADDFFSTPPSGFAGGFGVYDDLGFLLYYSPLSYSYLGRYFFVDDFGLGVSGGGQPQPAQPSGAGRVINGVGYTQVRPRDAGPTSRGSTASTSSDGTTGSTSSGSASGSSGSSGSSSSGSGSGGGSVSSGGFSSGGGGDTGRTAVPR